MFKSATVKLTVWYLIILVSISILFSIVIFSIATREVGSRINYLQQSSRPLFDTVPSHFDDLRDDQIHAAQSNLIASLAITNAGIWIVGGFGSYLLARRTLRPIEEAHEAQSRFTSDASHELRTPLASMKTEIEVALRDSHLTSGEMKELLESNLEEVNKLTILSQTLLQLSRLDHDNIVREKVSLSDVAQNITKRFDKTGKRIVVTSPHPIYALANKSSVEELFTILIDNAIKYSPDNSVVTISLMQHRSMVGFTIVNEGQGIDPSILPYIFDRFYQADPARTNESNRGYGLGLALAKKIVQLHNGELSVSSAVNAPTTFQVLLPIFSKVHAKNH
jgi:signal transduction histidine kinase